VPTARLLILVSVFFLTSVISVVTGSTSLVTVPVMMVFGIEPHIAVATNMMALIFMTLGGSLPFTHKGVLERRVLPLSITLTLVGSALGALLLLHVPVRALQLTIAIAMIAVAAFSLARKESGTSAKSVSFAKEAVGYFATFSARCLRRILQWRICDNADRSVCLPLWADFSPVCGNDQGRQPVFVCRRNADLRMARRR